MAVHLLGNSPQFSDDLPLVGKATATTADVAMDLTSPIQMGHVVTSSDAQVSSKALAILSFLSVLSLVTGPVLCERAVREIRLSEQTGDLWGRRLAILDLAKGSLQIAAGGACALPASVITFMLFFTTSKAAQVAGQILMQVGAAFFGLVACLQAISSVIELGISWSCRKTINQKQTPQEALFELQTQLKDPLLQRAWMRSVDEKLLAEVAKTPPEHAQEVVNRVLWTQTKAMAIEFIVLSLSIAGAALTVLGLCLTSAAAAFPLSIAGMVLGLMWLMIDLGAVIETIESGKFSSYERPLLIACAIFCGLVVLGAAFFASGGLALGVTITVGLLLAILHFALLSQL